MRSVTRTPLRLKSDLVPASDDRGGRVGLLRKHKFLLAIARDNNLASSAKAVAAVLLEYFNDDPKAKNPGWAWPSLSNLAKATELPRRTVVDAVRNLVEQGHFERQSGDRHRSNRYRPCWERSPRVEGHPRAENHPTLERSTAPRGRADHRPVLPSTTPRQRFRSKQKSDACAQGNKESASVDDNAIVTLTLEAALNELSTGSLIKPRRAFDLFLSLWPKPDSDPALLKGAWINNVYKTKEEVRPVLMAALLWNRLYRLYPAEYVPRPGWWLKHSGWVSHLPYRCDVDAVEALDEALQAARSDTLGEVDAFAAENLVSPFQVLCEIAPWPDDDWQIARNAFNGVLSKGRVTADEIIRKADRKRRQCDQAGDDLPKLGWWIKKRFRDEDDEPVNYRRVVVTEAED